MYRGTLQIYTKGQQIPTEYVSDYIFSFEDSDGTVYVIDGKGAELEYGSTGHFINSDVGVHENLFPVQFEYSIKDKAFKVVASFSWDSGNCPLSIIIDLFIFC